jgi:heme/copper-type cytochrome/quinol oxidase subunit 2
MLETLFFPGGTWSWFALFWFLLGVMGTLVFLCLVIAPFFIWKYTRQTAHNTHNTMMYSKHLLEMTATRLTAIETALSSPTCDKEQQRP